MGMVLLTCPTQRVCFRGRYLLERGRSLPEGNVQRRIGEAGKSLNDVLWQNCSRWELEGRNLILVEGIGYFLGGAPHVRNPEPSPVRTLEKNSSVSLTFCRQKQNPRYPVSSKLS